MKSFAITIVILILLVVAYNSPNVSSGTEPTIRIEPTMYFAHAIGETVTFSIIVDNAINLNDWGIYISFAPSLLVVTGYEFGNFMRDAGIPTIQSFYNSSLIGNVRATEFTYATDVVNGSGVVLRLNATVLDSGYSSLHLYNTELLNASYDEIPHETQDGAFVMTSHPVDYNDDSTIDSYVDIVTNSTYLDSFAFNETGKYITFRVGGEQDMGGYSNITIPKNLLDASTPSEWNVIIDSNVTMFVTGSNDTYTSIYLTYNQGLHIIRVDGDVAIPEFSSILLSALIIIGIAAIILARRTRASYIKKG